MFVLQPVLPLHEVLGGDGQGVDLHSSSSMVDAYWVAYLIGSPHRSYPPYRGMATNVPSPG